MRSLWCLLVVLSLLSGCGGVRHSGDPQVLAADVPVMPLMPLEEFDEHIRIQQKVTGQYQSNSYQMLCVLELQADQLSMAGLSVQGIKLFTVQYKDAELTQSVTPLIPGKLRPRQIVADIQLALWPIEILQRELTGDWQILDAAGSRRLLYKNELIADVGYSGNDPLSSEFSLIHHKYGYSLKVETLEVVNL